MEYKLLKCNLLLIIVLCFSIACNKETPEPKPTITSNLELAQEFGVYKLQGDTMPRNEAGDIAFEELMIVEEPLITLADIVYYDTASHTLHLSKPVSWDDVGAGNRLEFIVAEGGKALQDGRFYLWPNCCFPQGRLTITIYNDVDSVLQYTMQVNGELQEAFERSLPERYLRKEFAIELKRAEVLSETVDEWNMKLEVQIQNRSDQDYYIFDPAKAPPYVREIELTPNLSGFFLYRYRLVTNIHYNPIGRIDWSLDWYTLVRAGETVNFSFEMEQRKHNGLAIGETLDVVFAFDNLAGMMPLPTYRNQDPAVWLGKMVSKQQIRFE